MDLFCKLTKATEILENVILKDYTTFKVGGQCRYLCLPKTIDEIVSVISILKENKETYRIIGNGSNTLIADSGYNGTIILLKNNFSNIIYNNNFLTAQAGVNLTKLAAYAQSLSLSGLEFSYGIPASVGGAVYMNAGAYDGEVKDVLKSVTYLDSNQNIVTKDAKDLDFSYRHSIFHNTNDIIISADFSLIKKDSKDIMNKMEEFMEKRVSKQPLEYPSAGSTFKRPNGYFAAALIDECGLKGYTVGGAMVSTKHSGFIINYNNATCSDILALIDHVKKVVYEKKGVQLECEVRI